MGPQAGFGGGDEFGKETLRDVFRGIVGPVPHIPCGAQRQMAAAKRGLSKCPVTRISHIGSTAVPGIWAKNIVDVLIEVSQDTEIAQTAAVLEACGFFRMSAEAGRISFNRGYTDAGFADKVFHIHLRYVGDHDELYFRDYLIAHPQIAKEYEALKLELWRQFAHNRDAYTNGKSGFVQKWTKKAKEIYAGRY